MEISTPFQQNAFIIELNNNYRAARWYETGYFVRLCSMKSYRESLEVTLSHGTQNDSKTFKITKWDKVRQSGTCFKNDFKNNKRIF